MAATVTQPRIMPKWNLPARSWNRPKAIRKIKGPERSPSSCRLEFTRIGLRMETVLRQIWRVLIPSSSRSGGSSSKEDVGMVDEVKRDGGGAEDVEAAAADMSKDMKGRAGLEAPEAEFWGRGGWN